MNIEEINFENQQKNLCVVCSKPMQTKKFKCLKCQKDCEINTTEISSTEVMQIIDAKSKCCDADVEVQGITCSDGCHKILVDTLIITFGRYKKVVGPDRIERRVPTKDIIERGLKTEDLIKYPIWIENDYS